MALTFRQRIAQAEAMALADELRFQPELQSGLSLRSEGILGPLTSEGLHLSEAPPAEEAEVTTQKKRSQNNMDL